MQESEHQGVRTKESPEYLAKAVWEQTQDWFHMKRAASVLHNPCYITHAICQSTGVHPDAIFNSFLTASEQQGPAGRVAALLGCQFSNCSIFQLLQGGDTVL